MIFNLYSVHDTLAGIYYMPFQTMAVQPAIRAFTDIVNDPNQSIYRNPSDYNLMQIGTFDDSTGMLSPFDKPEFIVNALAIHRDHQS